jgi:hypothetical protein
MTDKPTPANADRKTALPYVVMIDDNFHYMDEDERVTHGSFATLDEAIEACKKIVDESLVHLFEPGMSVAQLNESYHHFGDDPFIVGPHEQAGTPAFSAWTYAASRCEAVVRASGHKSKGLPPGAF